MPLVDWKPNVSGDTHSMRSCCISESSSLHPMLSTPTLLTEVPCAQMRLASAYQAVCGVEAAFTAIGINAGLPHCTVDYIWYTPQVC